MEFILNEYIAKNPMDQRICTKQIFFKNAKKILISSMKIIYVPRTFHKKIIYFLKLLNNYLKKKFSDADFTWMNLHSHMFLKVGHKRSSQDFVTFCSWR